MNQIAQFHIERKSAGPRFDNPVQWASGYFMPFYVNNRALFYEASMRKAVVDYIIDHSSVDWSKVDFIAGVATGGIVWGTCVAEKLGLDYVTVRTKPKDHGLGAQIDGEDPEGLRGRQGVLIEDLISTGGSSATPAKCLQDIGATCAYCVALFSYNFQVAEKTFRELVPTCLVYPILTFNLLLAAMKESGEFDVGALHRLENEWYPRAFDWGDENGYPRKKK